MSILPEVKPNIGQELLNVPMGDMIRDMAFAIADAQMRLDEKSIEVAQMLGGLKQVPGLNGAINFEDSRVFFGKEKLKMLDAIEMYNSSSDAEYKIRILDGLGTASYTYVCTESPYTTIKNMEEDKDNKFNDKTVGTIYSLGTGTAKKYYKHEGEKKETKAGTTTTTKIFPEIKYYNVPITPVSNVSMENVIYIPQRVSMLELGFSPTFYQFVDTIIEVKINIKYVAEGEIDEEKKYLQRYPRRIYTSIVNANHSQKYTYSSEGSSLLRTKLVPIPPPVLLEERIRALMEVAKEKNK